MDFLVSGEIALPLLKLQVMSYELITIRLTDEQCPDPAASEFKGT
jgi:hypothetical protein